MELHWRNVPVKQKPGVCIADYIHCTCKWRLTCSIHSFPTMILCTLQLTLCQEYASLCLSTQNNT